MKAQPAKTKEQPEPTNSDQVMARKFSKDKSKCRVTFWLPQGAAPDARSVAVAGSFNDWDLQSHQMSKLDNGDYTLVIELEAGKEHEFRFIVDDTSWENAWNADKYVWSEHGNCENSVVVT
jgi:1,4-alpha-glucan branching enzyme